MRYWSAFFKYKGFMGQGVMIAAPTRRKAISAMRRKYGFPLSWKLISIEEITEGEFKAEGWDL